MCVETLTRCLSYCIRPATATNIIGWVYTILSFLMVVLFGVPAAAPHNELPPQRAYFYTALAASSAVLLLFSLLLLCATHKRVPALMWPWVVWAWAEGAALVALCVVGIVMLPSKYDEDSAMEPYIIAMYFIYATLLIYSGIIVNTHRKDVAQERRERRTRANVKIADEVVTRQAQYTMIQSLSSNTYLV
ncbi:hypothetical protein ACJJTC_016386 [Scirpophaga incertulas]